MPWVEIGDRVFARRFEFLDQQIGVVLGGDDVLVVDTRSTPGQAQEVADSLREITRSPISIVVDTHHHWDHAWGNHTFRPATIWGHARAAERLRLDQSEVRAEVLEYYPELAAELRTLVVDPPDQTFADRAVVHVGDRLVELAFHGRGHTDGDISVLVPDANVLFAGDLVENGAPPSFGDGFPIDWPDAVERLLPLANGPVVPGHGAVGDRAFLEAQLGMFRELAGLARRIHAGEATIEDGLAAAPFGPQTPRDAFERALAQLRGELD